MTDTPEQPVEIVERKVTTVPVYFMWNLVTPDPRQYKPAAPQLAPLGVSVQVDVPLTPEYIANYAEVILWELGKGDEGTQAQYILTPDGMRYCIKVLEYAMQANTPLQQEEDTLFSNFGEKKVSDDWPDDEEDVVIEKPKTKKPTTKPKKPFKKQSANRAPDWDEDNEAESTDEPETEFNFE